MISPAFLNSLYHTANKKPLPAVDSGSRNLDF